MAQLTSWMTTGEVTIDGYHVKPIAVKCREVPTPYHDLELIESRIKAGVKDHQDPANMRLREFREELMFFVKHGIHRSYGIEFYRCDNTTCAHCTCTSQVPREKSCWQQFVNLATTCISCVAQRDAGQALPDVAAGPWSSPCIRHMPSCWHWCRTAITFCWWQCSLQLWLQNPFTVQSKSAAPLHTFSFWRPGEGKEGQVEKRQREEHSRESHGPPKKVWKCGYGDCSFMTSTQYRLRQHKETEQHKRQRGRPVKWYPIGHSYITLDIPIDKDLITYYAKLMLTVLITINRF